MPDRFLERHVQLNKASNVTALALAVSDVPGTRQQSADGTGGKPSSRKRDVHLDSLDAIYAQRRLPPPDFMRIHTAGNEVAILAGAARLLREIQPTIFLSAHGEESHETCWSLLSRAGYRPELQRNGGRDGRYVVLATPR